MNRASWVLLALLGFVSMPLAAQQIGGGVSIFIPESSWLGHGSVSYEAKVQTSIGLGGLFSLPVGIAYDKVYGLLPQGGAQTGSTLPWAVTDSFMLFTGIRITIPISVLFLQAEAGGIGQWNAGILPLDGNIGASLAPPGTIWAMQSVNAIAPFGYGYYAGGSIGVNVRNVRVALDGGYRYTVSPLDLTGTYYQVTTGSPTASGPISLKKTDSALRLAGVYVGLTGSFSY